MKTCLAWVGGLVIALVVGIFVLSICIRIANVESELGISYDSELSQLETYLQRETYTDEFGLSELRSAFRGLPASFEGEDSTEIEIGLRELGFGDYFSDVVVFLSEYPIGMIMAASGQISDYRLTYFDNDISSTKISDIVQGFFRGADVFGADVALHEVGALPSLTAGDRSFGGFADFTVEGARLRMEYIMFRRGNLVGVVYVYIPTDTQPLVSIDEAARMLDLKMRETILARYGER